MLPALAINDRLIVDKVSDRFKDPSRGNIVVGSRLPLVKHQPYSPQPTSLLRYQ